MSIKNKYIYIVFVGIIMISFVINFYLNNNNLFTNKKE